MDYNEFKKDVIHFGEYAQIKIESVWRIKVNGKFIKVRSGRSVWANRGHAVNAFKNSFLSHRGPDSKTGDEWMKKLIEEGVLEFVNVNN
jgi:hypothetical protein